MTDKLTAVVIGGGHNGLVCASYLAKAGYDVTVLEARSETGGGLSTREFAEGYRVSGLAHVCYPFPEVIAREIGLAKARSGNTLDTVSLGLDGRHLRFSGNNVKGERLSADDISAYSAFKKEFHRYADALMPLIMNKPPRLKDMDRKDMLTLAKLGWKLRFGLGAETMSEFLRVGGINIYDVLNELIDDEQLKAAIAVDAVMGHQMGPRTPTTVLTYLQRQAQELSGPLFSPEGGMGALASQLTEVAQSAGVTIRTSAEVASIRIEEGRTTGVVLNNGESLNADLVVSNADAKTTFLKLMDVTELDAMFAHRVHKTRTPGNVARLHFALSDLPAIKGLNEDDLAQRLLVAPDMRYMEHAFNHSKYGEFSEAPILEITLPSIKDPSLVSGGGHVMSVSASYAPYNLKSGWETGAEVFKESVITLIESYAPGFTGLVQASELLTPRDIEREFKVDGGH
ncbi:MAG: NAD(P)/FAD-dependent oxidoreductase, partial [Gammaproteobacteria bacterium]|nr:NAD(P)/FAD-dependent oxidoreductase [Gammaproteobacteria bacterium]